MDSSPDNSHKMSKYILSESVIDQQYRILDIFLKRVTYLKPTFLKLVSENIRSTVHQFYGRGGSIFLEGGV